MIGGTGFVLARCELGLERCERGNETAAQAGLLHMEIVQVGVVGPDARWCGLCCKQKGGSSAGSLGLPRMGVAQAVDSCAKCVCTRVWTHLSVLFRLIAIGASGARV